MKWEQLQKNGAERAAWKANNGDLTSLHSLHGIFNLEDVSIGTWGRVRKQTLELKCSLKASYLNTAIS